MFYKDFLTLNGKDFKGRTLENIWSFSDKETEEINIINEFLPSQLSHDQTKVACEKKSELVWAKWA